MKKILAFRFSALGDVAMLVPVFREFLEQNPEAEILMLSRKNFAPLFAGLPRLNFLGVNLEDYKGIFGMRRLAKEVLQVYQPDLVADFHDVIRSKILRRVFRRKGFPVYVIDKGKEEKDHLTDIRNLEKKPLKPTVFRYADVFSAMGFPLKLSQKLRPKNIEKSGIGFAPFAQHAGKMLPLKKSLELARVLSRKHKIYFFGGGAEESKILAQWQTQIPNSESFAGKMNLAQELEKISTLKLMISMDSANMHLASLAGTRCISVWGATHPFAGFLGFGQSAEDAVQLWDLTCRPCSVFGDKACYRGDWACLHELDIQKILEKIE